MSATGEVQAGPPRRSRLWWWVVAVCALQVGAWTAWLTIASKHRVAEVPLATSR